MEKIGAKQTKDRIAEILRNEILSGRISDGEELAQEQLADILEVSRMPVREALQILEMEGFLVRLPNRHMQVAGIREETVYENMRAIAALETEIIYILMDKKIEMNFNDCEAHSRFHHWFSENLDNSYIRQIHRKLLEGYPNYIWENCVLDNRLQRINSDIKNCCNRYYRGDIPKFVGRYYNELGKTLLAHIKENLHE